MDRHLTCICVFTFVCVNTHTKHNIEPCKYSSLALKHPMNTKKKKNDYSVGHTHKTKIRNSRIDTDLIIVLLKPGN